MIQINLLPPELQTLEKTPLSRFIVIITGAALTTASLFVFLVLTFSTLPAAMQRKKDIEKYVKQKETLAARYDELEQEIQFFKLREDAVKKLRKERYIWSKTLFDFHRVVEETKHVTIKSISIEEEKSRSRMASTGGSKMAIVVDGYSIIPELSSAADFMMNIRNSEFYKSCESIKTGTTVIRPKGDDYVCEFSLRIIMKPRTVSKPPPPAAGGRGGARGRRGR